MGQHVEGEIAAGGVAGEINVRWIPVGGFENVAQCGDGLDELCGIGGVRGEGVGDGEDAEVLACGLHFLYEFVQEVEVTVVWRYCEPATCYC